MSKKSDDNDDTFKEWLNNISSFSSLKSPEYKLHIASSEKQEELTNSFIRGFFDTFNIKKAVKTLFSFTPFKITDQFVDGLILFCYFFVVFISLNAVKYELNAATVTLLFIGIPIIIEIIVANSPSLKKYFSNEEKAVDFLKKFSSMTHEQIHQNINTINFSVNHLSLLLDLILKNKEKIPIYIIKDIIANNDLTIEHINTIFTTENLTLFIEDNGEFVVSQLFRFKGRLNKENIKNLYSVFKDNDNVIKMLVASQSESEILIRENPSDERLKNYFNVYQIEKKQYDFYLKFISLRGLNRIHVMITAIIFFGILIITILSTSEANLGVNNPSSLSVGFFFYIMGIPLIITTIGNGIFLDPIFNYLRRWHMKHLKKRILSTL